MADPVAADANGLKNDPREGTKVRESSAARKWIALSLMAALAGLAWETIEAGKVRSVVLLLLGVFALRIVLAASTSASR